MNTLEFSSLLSEFRERHETDRAAAAAVGAPYATFLRWLNGHCVPNYFTMVAVVRQVRDGRDPLVDVQMSAAEFAAKLRNWRANHGFTQHEAAVALGVQRDAIPDWETQSRVPQQPALAEVLRRLRMPVDEERVKMVAAPRPLIEPKEFAARLREWRQRYRLSRNQAAEALRNATGLKTTDRTIYCWETGREMPWRPLIVLEKLQAPPVGVTTVHGWLKRSVRQRDPRATFGKKLRAWRKANGLNQAEACKALGLPLDQALISDWERAKSLPRQKRLRALLSMIAKPLSVRSPKLQFPQRLREWRDARGFSQLEACIALDLPRDQGRISKWERGKEHPRPAQLSRLLAIISEASQ